MHRIITIGLLGGLAILCGCKSTPESFPFDGVYSGYYSRGFEVSSFRPQGSTERWSLSSNKTLEPIMRATDGGAEIYLVVRGTITPKGSYGHLGGNNRELYVSDVIEFLRVTGQRY